MTGSGTFAVDSAAGRLEAEARSVNHRFLKSTVRAHGPLPTVTAAVEAAVRKHVQRGHVTVHLRFRPGPRTDLEGMIHTEAFASAARKLTELANQHGLAAVTVRDVTSLPGVLADDHSPGDDAELNTAIQAVVTGVVDELQAAREREGALLTAEIEDLLDRIALAVASLSLRAADVPEAYRARLHKRLNELLAGSGVAPDPAQVARECAVLADKSDVREEIARLEAHIQHARTLLSGGGAVGRRLDFLAQEFHREANTVASKTNDLALSQTVLDLRAGVERLREQVQNLE